MSKPQLDGCVGRAVEEAVVVVIIAVLLWLGLLVGFFIGSADYKPGHPGYLPWETEATVAFVVFPIMSFVFSAGGRIIYLIKHRE